MELMEGYIEFAINNDLVSDNYYAFKTDGIPLDIHISNNLVSEYKNREGWDVYIRCDNFIELITSKPFIQAVARGVLRKDNKIIGIMPDGFWTFDGIEKSIFNWKDLAREQSVAISNNTLSQFISSLGIEGQE